MRSIAENIIPRLYMSIRHVSNTERTIFIKSAQLHITPPIIGKHKNYIMIADVDGERLSNLNITPFLYDEVKRLHSVLSANCIQVYEMNSEDIVINNDDQMMFLDFVRVSYNKYMSGSFQLNHRNRTHIERLPTDVVSLIYEFDPTYRVVQHEKVMSELRSKMNTRDVYFSDETYTFMFNMVVWNGVIIWIVLLLPVCCVRLVMRSTLRILGFSRDQS